ncbi:MAG: dnaE [Bacillales bacterium]|nr:dnaE [Bacillales bacterium]
MLKAHLNTTTSYSLLSSSIEISSLVRQAKSYGYESLAITDRNVMYSAIPFYNECLKESIKPIIGLNVGLMVDNKIFNVNLLAENFTGYQDLLKISSLILTNNKTHIDIKEIESLSSSILLIITNEDSELINVLLENNEEAFFNYIRTVKSIFNNVFIGGNLDNIEYLQTKIETFNKINIKLVFSNFTNCLYKQDLIITKYLQCIKETKKLNENKSLYKESYLIPPIELTKSQISREVIENTNNIADLCNVHIEFPSASLPKFPLPSGIKSSDYLHELCKKGLYKRYQNVTPELVERLAFELEVINKMHFEDYFLIVWDFMKYSRKNGILTGPGRGSAAGSLVSYVLGITDVDPIKYELLFERFLNPERISMPDIDIDFPDNRREEVINYVRNKYGDDHVAHIITFGTFGAKAAIRDIARVEGLQSKEIDGFSKQIPNQLGISLGQAYEQSEKFRNYVNQTEVNKRIYKIAQKIEGLPRHTSIHAAGIIISPEPLTNLTPLQKSSEGISITQYGADVLEQIGLLKMDFLGLRNLTLITRICNDIKNKTGVEIPIRDLPYDEKTFELLSKGNTLGIFQLESPGMRRVLINLVPNELEDIIAVNALYRPGPMEQIPTYIKNKHNSIKTNIGIREIQPILEKTYGVIIYQEQIMQIASTMAGFTLGESDMLRRAISKKKKDVLDKERLHFVNGCFNKGFSSEDANKVYDLIVRFANYGFNRSHSVAYSIIAYQLAYLKANYPTFFYSALLTSVIGSEDKIRECVREARKQKIKIKCPSINFSDFGFKTKEDIIYFGLGAIKNIGWATVKDIVNERKKKPFTDIFDFVVRMTNYSFSRKTFEQLIFSGCLDDFSKDRSTLLANLDAAIEYAELVKPTSGNQLDLFLSESIVPKPIIFEVLPMTEENKANFEKETLGLSLSYDPFEDFELFKEDQRFSTIDNFLLQDSKKLLKIPAMIETCQTVNTKNNKQMAFVTLSNGFAEINSVIFPDSFIKNFILLKKGNKVIAEGVFDNSKGRSQFVINQLYPIKAYIDQILLEKSINVFIKIPNNSTKIDITKEIEKISNKYPGQSRIYIYFEDTNKTVLLDKNYSVSSGEFCLKLLRNVFGDQNIAIKKQ